MRLAWGLGYPHADHLLDALTSTQYLDVLAFCEIEPDPVYRADLRAAQQSLITARAAGAKDAKMQHFLFDFKPDVDQTPEEMEAAFESWNTQRRKSRQ